MRTNPNIECRIRRTEFGDYAVSLLHHGITIDAHEIPSLFCDYFDASGLPHLFVEFERRANVIDDALACGGGPANAHNVGAWIADQWRAS